MKYLKLILLVVTIAMLFAIRCCDGPDKEYYNPYDEAGM